MEFKNKIEVNANNYVFVYNGLPASLMIIVFE